MFSRICANHRQIHAVGTHRSLWGPLFILLVSCALGLAVVIAFPSPGESADTLILNVIVNGESKGDFFAARSDDGDFLIRQEDYAALGLTTTGAGVTLGGERYISLRSVRDIAFSFDEKNLSLAITAPQGPPAKSVVDLNPPSSRKLTAYQPREFSAFLNYGLTYAYGDPTGFQSFTTSDKLGVRAGDVLFLTDSVYTKTRSTDAFVRLMSTATYERRQDLQWFTAGDVFASSGELGSTLNIGGLGLSKVYRMDPYLIKQPTFSITGVTALPSQVEIYMDGTLVRRENVQAGEFDLRNFNYYGGSRTVEVLIRDPFGNVRRLSYPAYFTDVLLKRGLHEYSYNIGFLREQYGVKSNDYGKPAFSAFHRYGVSDSVNLGARAEGSDGIYNGGVQASFLFPRAGVLTAALAGSGGPDRTGGALSLAHYYQRGNFGANLLLREFSRDYTTVENRLITDKTRREANVGVNVTLARAGVLSLGYAETEKYAGVSTRATSAAYSKSLSKTSMLLVTARAVRETDTDYEVMVTLNFYPGRDLLYSARYQRTGETDSETLQVQKNLPVGEGVGYRATLERSAGDSATASTLSPFVQYNGRYGTYAFDSILRHAEGKTSDWYSVTAAGSLAYAGGLFGFARPVNDSFTFVLVDSLKDVNVLVNNEIIGRTDSSGAMIIPTMASYQVNQITMDTSRVPMDFSMSGVNSDISPSAWSGSCISFNAARVRAVTGTLAAKKGGRKEPLEYYEIAMTVGDQKLTFQTGKGGEFYFEDALPRTPGSGPEDQLSCRSITERRAKGGNVIKPGIYPASVDYGGRKCSFSITVPVTEDVITDIGEIVCAVSRVSGPETGAQQAPAAGPPASQAPAPDSRTRR